MSLRSIRTALAQNRQFVAVTVVLLMVLTLFPGSPGQIFLTGGSSPPATTSTTELSTSPPPSDDAPTVGLSGELPQVEPDQADQESRPGAEPLRMSEIEPPERGEREPEPTCDTDTLFATVYGVRSDVSGVLREIFNSILPGEDPERGYVAGDILERIVRLATGCDAESLPEDPEAQQKYFTGLIVEGLLEFADMVPDTGVEPLRVPPAVFDLTALLISVVNDSRDGLPVELREVLGPSAADIREYCGTLQLLLFLAPILVAESVPVNRDDLTRLMASTSAVCGLFDDDSFLDDGP